MTKKAIMVVAMVIMSMVGIAAAWATLNINPYTQDIDLNTYGYYVLILDSSNNMNALDWSASDPAIVASIDGGAGYPADSQIGATSLVPGYVGGSGPQNYNMRVMPKTGSVIGDKYDVTVTGINAYGVAKATVTGTVGPIPEPVTFASLSIGMFGLLMLRRKSIKNA